MGRISRTTNPTGVRKLDRKLFVVRTSGQGASREFWVERFEHEQARLLSDTQVACVAHAGSTEMYFELGEATAIRNGPNSIGLLAADRPLKFRFVFFRHDDPQLVAFADGVKAVDESGQLGSSLVDIEPADLQGVVWRLELPESSDDKPNVLVERSLFPTPSSASNHHWFALLVMPEVMRQIAVEICRQPDALEDSGSWMHQWTPFLEGLGVHELQEDADDQAKSDWVEDVVSRFCDRGALRSHMAHAISEMDGGMR